MKEVIIGIVIGVSIFGLVVALMLVGVPALTQFLDSLKNKHDL